ncbi:MAG: hypothetical protein AVDCRST_MAG93-9107 [uncultured Chloroflexia bacterium]|uniref:Uncharacterized protein n=1 Tax=uncultured Chloroflexia bacterium TaxID=1672391 RepID=A0A6J4NBG2_9CHLR|nr:MAG: hypothetical protein AVDCRST_MAG93-9107 [uncultured Chloroflexia bacterium]
MPRRITSYSFEAASSRAARAFSIQVCAFYGTPQAIGFLS